MTRKKRAKYPELKKIDADEWNRIVGIFARVNGNVTAAAIELDWPQARCRRVFNRGYPTLGLPPIRTALAMDSLAAEEIRASRYSLDRMIPRSVSVTNVAEVEQKAVVIVEAEAARVRRLVEIEEERRKARADAVEARGEEALLIKCNRQNSMALNGLTSKMLRGAAVLTETIEKELVEIAKGSTLSTSHKLQLVKSAAQIARFNSEATMLAIKAERMVLGQPIEPDANGVEDSGTLEQAVGWIESAAEVVRKAQRRGLLSSGNS